MELYSHPNIEHKNYYNNYFNICLSYKEVYILTVKNNSRCHIKELYQRKLSNELIDKYAEFLILLKGCVKLLNNYNHYNTYFIASDTDLNSVNVFNFKLDKINIVIPILNIELINILDYLEQYKPRDQTLQNLYNLILINTYYNNNINIDYINRYINNIFDASSWKDISEISLNFYFKNRKFIINKNFLLLKSSIEDIDDLYDENENISNLVLNELNKVSNINKIINSNINVNDIENLMIRMDNKTRFLLFCNLLISVEYCHFVINNKFILKLMTKEIQNFAPLFRYLFSYTWTILYLREFDINNDKSENYLFDLETANLLPVFPMNHVNPKTNPYLPVLINDIELDPPNNFCGIPDYANFKNKSIVNNGLCDINDFKIKMNIFVSGIVDLDIFKDYNFKENNVILTGSLISACLQKYHPLMSRIQCSDKANSSTQHFKNYLDEYYIEADTNLKIFCNNIFDFLFKIKQLYSTILNNLSNYYIDEPYLNTISHENNFILIKTYYLTISDDFIKKYLIPKISLPDLSDDGKLDYIKNNLFNSEIIKLVTPYYYNLAEKHIDNIIKLFNNNTTTNWCSSYSLLTHINTAFFLQYSEKINCEDILDDETLLVKDNELNIFLQATYSYKISNYRLARHINILPIFNENITSVIKSTVLPCIRGYYDGETVYLTPSCISSHLTFMNLDYKHIYYDDIREVLHKYRMRGFGTWLNKTEKKMILLYTDKTLFWKNLYNSINQNIINIYGPQCINSKLFRPQRYNIGYYSHLRKINMENRYDNGIVGLPIYKLSQQSITNYIIERFSSIRNNYIDYDKFFSIDKLGSVIPIQEWIIKAVYEDVI